MQRIEEKVKKRCYKKCNNYLSHLRQPECRKILPFLWIILIRLTFGPLTSASSADTEVLAKLGVTTAKHARVFVYLQN